MVQPGSRIFVVRERPLYFFPFMFVIDRHKKITHTSFQFFFKVFLSVMVEIIDLALRAVIDSLEIHTINYLIKEKSRLILLCEKLYLG